MPLSRCTACRLPDVVAITTTAVSSLPLALACSSQAADQSNARLTKSTESLQLALRTDVRKIPDVVRREFTHDRHDLGLRRRLGRRGVPLRDAGGDALRDDGQLAESRLVGSRETTRSASNLHRVPALARRQGSPHLGSTPRLEVRLPVTIREGEPPLTRKNAKLTHPSHALRPCRAAGDLAPLSRGSPPMHSE